MRPLSQGHFGGMRSRRMPANRKAFGSLRESNMLLGPVGLDSGIVARLAALARESAAQSENMKRVLTQLGVNRPPWVGADLKAFIQDAWPAYQSMTREQGLTAE